MAESDREYLKRLEWALVNLLSGVPPGSVGEGTRLRPEARQEIDAIRQVALRRSWARVDAIQNTTPKGG